MYDSIPSNTEVRSLVQIRDPINDIVFVKSLIDIGYVNLIDGWYFKLFRFISIIIPVGEEIKKNLSTRETRPEYDIQKIPFKIHIESKDRGSRKSNT